MRLLGAIMSLLLGSAIAQNGTLAASSAAVAAAAKILASMPACGDSRRDDTSPSTAAPNNDLAAFVYATSGIAVVVSKKSSTHTITGPGNSHNNGGTVRLRSTDARDTPSIVFNSFDTGNTDNGGDVEDLQAAYDGVQLAREMFDKLVPGDGKFKQIWPGADNISSEADVKQFIRDEAWGHHASCSAPIGADDDANAVLDTVFKVRGVQGLRVVDALAFPKIPGTFVALPTYMISEKGADVIIKGL
ncbi:hypothetical protein LTR86_004720 [Recurvomyces mirabilis]|nr:hypothetical protein LTR86_004720 [Recurvomyces mirabilis]